MKNSSFYIFKGQWGTYRHLLLDTNTELLSESKSYYVNSLTKGDLCSLKWQEHIEKAAPNKVRVHYAALNFRDIMLSTGRLADDLLLGNRIERQCSLGLEYSGIELSTGRRIMGTVPYGGLATIVEPHLATLMNVPDNWSLEEAATVPVVYLTVYSAFFQHAHVSKGHKILIHAGTGGVGLAAIRVAVSYGLEVFTTVSSQTKRDYLLELYPQLNPSHIGNSRDLSFYEMVMLETNGTGVDYVLNSLAGDKLIASIKCLGKGGHFLEIGKFDLMNDTKLGLGLFQNGISFHSIALDKHLYGAGHNLPYQQTFLEDLKSGIIVPLKRTVYPANEVESAFRFLASGKHLGKVLLQVREKETDEIILPIDALPRTYCDSAMTYIICGGLGGFGLELADWLVLRGCKKLVLSSRRGITMAYQAYRIE